MTAQEKIKILESRVAALENENEILKSMWKKQTLFGNRMTQIVSEMDDLLEKKKLEIQSLTNQLAAKSNTSIRILDDFSTDLESTFIKSETGSFLEYRRQVKIRKERLENEFEKTKDGKFKCPYKDICDQVCKSRQNLRNHICLHTGERPYVCDICGRGFIQQTQWKRHMLLHPEMNGQNCKHCYRRFTESEVDSHQETCRKKKKYRKRKRSESDSETSFTE